MNMHSYKYKTGGREYIFSDSYYSAVSSVRPLVDIAKKQIFHDDILDEYSDIKNDVSFEQFLAKYYEVLLLIEALKQSRISCKFERSLDIGSGPALQSRIMKMVGCISNIEAIDIYDGSGRCSDRLLLKHASKFQLLNLIYRLRKIVPSSIRKYIGAIKRYERKMPYGSEYFSYIPDDAPYKYWIKRKPSINTYHVGDILEHEGEYDLITSYMALEYLDFNELACKVSSLLTKSGIFAFVVSYWWYPINNTLLYGKFPYLLQQLSTDEVLKYYRTEHPDLDIEGINQRLTHSDPYRPTVSNYQEIAYKHDLVPVNELRLNMDLYKNPRAVIGPLGIDALDECDLFDVLKNARLQNPTVSLVDLITSHILMVFRKK